MWRKRDVEKMKIFLVEDESLIRNGIQNGIAWEKEGFEFAGAASDGELAYPMILAAKPDILITDIKMPFMDGLELSRLVKQELPDIKILILSGHDEFLLAREAIEIGVTEYLLKPVSAARLLHSLNQMAVMIGKEKEEKKLLEKYSSEMRENTEYEKMRFFTRIMSGNMPLSVILETGKRFGMNLSARSYNVILFNILMETEHRVDTKQRIKACERIEKLVEYLPWGYSFRRAEEGWTFLVTAESGQQMQERTDEFVKKLTMLMGEFQDLKYFGGIGEPVLRLRELRSSFMEAEMVFAGRFSCSPNKILSVNESRMLNKDAGFEINSYEHIGNSRSSIEKFLNNGTKKELDGFVSGYVAGIQEENFRSNLMRQYIAMDVYVAVMAFVERLCADGVQQQEEMFREDMQKIRTLSDMQNFMEDMLVWALSLRDQISDGRYQDIICMAQDIIRKSYMTEDISMNMVASKVGMSPSYFSCIFSKEVGKTFVEYLTETRMAKAKELLMCSSLKSSEIGFEVGYKDPHYFSYLFKKTQGYSPKEYRARKNEEESARHAV